MKTIKQAIAIFILMIISSTAIGQSKGTAKNFVGVFAGVEWNTISGLTGIQAERSLYQKGNIVFGIKATHAFSYKLSNLSLLHSYDEGQVHFTSVATTAQWFTKQTGRGFFLETSLGGGSRSYKYGGSTNVSGFVAFDAGFGWQVRLGDKTRLRLSSSLAFAGGGGITTTSISFGF